MFAMLCNKLLKTYLLAWVILVLGLCITAGAAWSLFAKVRALDENRFQRQAGQTVEALRDRFDKYVLALSGLADFAASRPSLSRAEWNFRVRLLLPEKSYPGLLELGLLEATASQQPQPALALDTRPVSTLGEETNGLRLQHAWICPPSAFDGPSPRFLNDAVVRQTAQAALRSGVPSYCYRRELGTEIAGKPALGLTIFVPLMERRQDAALTNHLAPAAQPVAQLAEIRAQGVVFGSIEPNLLLGSLFGTAPREVGFDLFSGHPLSAKTWLNVSGSSPPTLTPDFRPYLRANVPLQFHGQEWTMVIYTTRLFEQESSRYRPWTVIVGGTALSMLVGALLFVQIHSRVRQEAISGDLRSACEDLQQAQNERECISRDLHDGAIQSLYGLQLSLGHYDLVRALDAEGASKLFERCCQAVDALIAELRTFIVQGSRQEEADMSPNPAVTLQKLVRRFQNSSSIPIELVVDTGPTLTVPQVAQMHLRQIAQEALSNSLRHGRPRHIKVELVTDNGHLHLRVSDDGRGFNAAQAHASGRGLANMQGRAVQLGGKLSIESRHDCGTKVLLEIPIKS